MQNIEQKQATDMSVPICPNPHATRWVPPVEQECLHFRSTWVYPQPPDFSGVNVTRSLVSCVCFVYPCLLLFFWPLCCLSFHLRILITPLGSSNSYQPTCPNTYLSPYVKIQCPSKPVETHMSNQPISKSNVHAYVYVKKHLCKPRWWLTSYR